MKALIDLHHQDLAHSFALTLTGRLGIEVVHPYGMEWFDEDYWAFEKEWHGDAVARQYLLGIWEGHEPDADGIVAVPDSRHPGYTIHGMTLEAARSQRWDLVISSVPANAPGLSRLARETGARFGIHVGNQWGDEAWGLTPDFAILSTTSVIPPGIPYVVVHQEFSLDDFRYEPPLVAEFIDGSKASSFGPIRSFVSCFPENVQPCYHDSVSNPEGEYGYFTRLARANPDLTWQVYGAYGTATPDEFEARNLATTADIGDEMRGAGAIWHAKHWSDGFGHVVHAAFAVGRPVIGFEGYYRDKMAADLWLEGVTSFDIARHTPDEIIVFLRSLRENPDRYLAMCEASAARFREVVSFEEDAELIRGLLSDVMAVAA